MVWELPSNNSMGMTGKQFFASRFLNPHESKYSTNELELLGVVLAVEHYKNYLYGSEFEVITDHKLNFPLSHQIIEIKHIIVD